MFLRVPPWSMVERLEELRAKSPEGAAAVEECSCPLCGWIYIAPDSGYVHDAASACPWVAL